MGRTEELFIFYILYNYSSCLFYFSYFSIELIFCGQRVLASTFINKA